MINGFTLLVVDLHYILALNQFVPIYILLNEDVERDQYVKALKIFLRGGVQANIIQIHTCLNYLSSFSIKSCQLSSVHLKGVLCLYKISIFRRFSKKNLIGDAWCTCPLPPVPTFCEDHLNY